MQVRKYYTQAHTTSTIIIPSTYNNLSITLRSISRFDISFKRKNLLPTSIDEWLKKKNKHPSIVFVQYIS